MLDRRLHRADLAAQASPASDAVRMLRFSTDDFPERQRLEAFREIYGRTIIKHDVQPIGDQPFHFEASMCSVPGLGLSSAVISSCRRWHRRQHIDSDDLILGIGLSGSCVVQQRGREAVVSSGEAVLTSTAHPAEATIGAPSRPISLRLPNSIFRSGIGDFDACLARRIPRNAEGLRLLTSYIGGVWKTDALKAPPLRDAVVAHIHDLVLLILGAGGDARELAEQRGLHAARRAAILRIIEKRSSDPSLNALAVAALVGVTPRYVHFLLEETGHSFSHHVLHRRLQKAAALLRDQHWRHRKISEVALKAGFTDLSHFSRAFRSQYGLTPTQMRAAAAVPK